jgi:uncharacterized repeat protein (TIGR01451 family)
MNRAFCFATVSAMALLASAGQAQVRISQVYGGGGNSGAQFNRDFVELFNSGTAPVSINGWSIQYASATGPGSQQSTSDPFSGWITHSLPNFTIQPGRYYLVQMGVGTTFNGASLSVDHQASVVGFTTGQVANLSAASGKVALVNNSTPLPFRTDTNANAPQEYWNLPQVVDFVGYGSANDAESDAAAAGLSNTTALFRRDQGCVDTNNNAADFEVGAPAPRNSTAAPRNCSVAAPDVVLTVASDSGCSPAVGSTYSITFNLANQGNANAPASSATFRLPPGLTFVSATATSGTVTGTGPITWNAGTLGVSASAQITINATVNSPSGLVVQGLATATGDTNPGGNNSAASNNIAVTNTSPFAAVAIASFSDTGIATPIQDGIFERRLTGLSRPFASPDGSKFIMRVDTDVTSTDENTGLIVGNIDANGGVTYSLVARERNTFPVTANPALRIRSGTFSNVMGINNAGQFVFAAATEDPNLSSPPALTTLIKGTTAAPVTQFLGEDDVMPAGTGVAGALIDQLRSPTIDNLGRASFGVLLKNGGSISTTNNFAFASTDGTTVLLQKGTQTPTGSPTFLSFLDDDGSGDRGGLRVSDSGTSWIGTGRLQQGGTVTANDDTVVIVNGGQVIREGTALPGFTAGTNSFAFGRVTMDADGTWWATGSNNDTTNTAFNAGQDWVVRNGVVVARTGDPVVTGSTETWSDRRVPQTFFHYQGSGADQIISGLTNVENVDPFTDGVLVWRNGAQEQILLRENAPVNIGTVDAPVIRYVNFFLNGANDVTGNWGFFGRDRKFYMVVNLRTAADVCANFQGSQLAQALIRIDLPAGGSACGVADLGGEGGSEGADSILDNNDFIVFIQLFFAQDARADLGAEGGAAGADGNFDNNDFIVFIQEFFAGGAASGCNGNP